MDKIKNNGFLSRWSSRKLVKTETQIEQKEQELAESPQVDAMTDKLAEAADAQKPDWQNPELDAVSRRQALRDIFNKPGIGIPDGLDEYERDYDYHNFAKLGDVVTHEMRRMLEQQMNELTATNPEADSHNDNKPESSEPEDNKLA